MSLYFLLGKTDPEMNAIVAILKARKLPYGFATYKRISATVAEVYNADPVALPRGTTLVCVECMPRQTMAGVKVHVIDHHRPGDPGYDLPPSQFWEASSLGQLHAFLNMEGTGDDRILAAMDHCGPDALHGYCPGVEPRAVFNLRCLEIAKSHCTHPDALMDALDIVLDKVQAYETEIPTAATLRIGTQNVHDLRATPMGARYSLDMLTAETAAARLGVPVLLKYRDAEDGPEKVVLTGYPLLDTVHAFMREWAPAQNLKDIYGVPMRRYAGGYLT